MSKIEPPATPATPATPAKFITEDANVLTTEISEELNEATGTTQKNYYIKGTFSTPDMKNRNGRIYPRHIWEKQVRDYQIELANKSVNTLGEFEHPARTSVSQMDAVMRITELKLENGLVTGKAKILNNNSKETNQIKALIDEGIKIGVSSRGVGKVKNGIVEEFKLVTYDLVTDPSDYGANLNGLTESLLESKSYEVKDGIIEEIQESTKKCKDDMCSIYSKEEIQEAAMTSFEKLITSLSDDIVEAKAFKVTKEQFNSDEFQKWLELNTDSVETKNDVTLYSYKGEDLFSYSTKHQKVTVIKNGLKLNQDYFDKLNEKVDYDKIYSALETYDEKFYKLVKKTGLYYIITKVDIRGTVVRLYTDKYTNILKSDLDVFKFDYRLSWDKNGTILEVDL